jgi:transcriptional regulator with XRE-family HTH domain
MSSKIVNNFKLLNRTQLTGGGSPVDVPLVIKHRLDELGLEQRDLASAAEVTESYVSQLLTRKKAPPAPNRTDIYDKMGKLLKLPQGELAKLADLQRREELKRKLADPPEPLFKEVRELVLRKCKPDKREQMRVIFERQHFGELERFVTQKLLDVTKRIGKEELDSENWLRLVARLNNRSYEAMRVAILEFLDADVFDVSIESCVSFLDPLIESWDIDLLTFGVEIVLNRRVAPGHPVKFEFVEKGPELPYEEERGFKEFLDDPSLSSGATTEEIEFLKRLRFKEKHPTALYYYRELQNLRDPLHFRPTAENKPRSWKKSGPPAGKLSGS